MLKKISVVMLAAMALAGCNKNRVEVVDGVKIQFHKHDDKAKKLKEGDIISFYLTAKTGSDSLLTPPVNVKKPERNVVPPKGQGGFKGSLQDGLRLLSVGDSATIYIPIDSLAKSAINCGNCALRASASTFALACSTAMSFSNSVLF